MVSARSLKAYLFLLTPFFSTSDKLKVISVPLNGTMLGDVIPWGLRKEREKERTKSRRKSSKSLYVFPEMVFF